MVAAKAATLASASALCLGSVRPAAVAGMAVATTEGFCRNSLVRPGRTPKHLEAFLQ